MTRLKTFLIIFIGLLSFSATYSHRNNPSQLLDDVALSLEHHINTPGPPLHIQDEKGQLAPSFAQWMCFHTNDTTLTCSKHMTRKEEGIKVPMIAVSTIDEYFEIETSVSEEVICEETIRRWKILLKKQPSFCVLAAYLQDLDSTSSLWILDAIKTGDEYWLSPTFQEKIK